MAEKIEMLTVSEWQTQLTGEMLLFGLLGRVLYANPSRDWLEPLLADNLFDSVPFAENQAATQQGLAALAQWTTEVGDTLTDQALRDVRVDYVNLFVGGNPMPVPPWESVYFNLDRMTFRRETLDVRRWYERFGLKLNTDNREPDDHIAFELSFVAQCAELALKALQEEQMDEFETLLAHQRDFLAQHLLRWGTKWSELAHAQARTDFYRGLVLLVRGGLHELTAILEIDIPQHIVYPGLEIR